MTYAALMEMCADPKSLEGLVWYVCYFTSPKHQLFYNSFLTVFALLALTAPAILLFGFSGALAKRARFAPVRWAGNLYTSAVRGIPDIIFFMFIPIALDQGVEFLRHKVLCPDWDQPIRQGSEFLVCSAAKMPLNVADQWVHQAWGFTLAIISYAIVFGAFTANIFDGALKAVPESQLETARAYGMNRRQVFLRIHLPQMWRYAMPGLSNLWMLLVKATPLLFLLGVQDIVYWARELGGTKTGIYSYPHGDWRLWYFSGLLIFYLVFTWGSEKVFTRLTDRVNRGHDSDGRRTGAAGSAA